MVRSLSEVVENDKQPSTEERQCHSPEEKNQSKYPIPPLTRDTPMLAKNTD